jgi:2-dehydropantoate 2-reductase
VIAVTLDENRAIIHLNTSHDLTFGERDGTSSAKDRTDRVRAVAAELAGAAFDTHASDDIVQDMWEKWLFLAALAGATCLMRAAVGDIGEAPGGTDFVLALLEECAAVAAANGRPPRITFIERPRGMLTGPGSPLTASMLRDIERNAPIEADHIVGDLIRRGATAGSLPLLRLAYTNLKAYEARRKRGAAAARPA